MLKLISKAFIRAMRDEEIRRSRSLLVMNPVQPVIGDKRQGEVSSSREDLR